MKLGFVEAVTKAAEFGSGDMYRIYMPGDITDNQSAISATWNNAVRTQDSRELYLAKMSMQINDWRLFDDWRTA